MKKILLLCILVGCLFSQSIDNLFKTRTANFYFKQYTWGNEFLLNLKGFAHKSLTNAKLILEIKYYDKVASRYSFVIQGNAKKYFAVNIECGPFNEPYQKILAGEYTATLLLSTKIQKSKVKNKLRFLKQDRNILFEKEIFWKNKEIFDQESFDIKKFYLDKINTFTNYHQNLINNSNEAFNVETSIKYGQKNRFVHQKRKIFSPILWRTWLREFQNSIKKEQLSLQKFHKKIYCGRHDKIEKNLEEFVFVLLRYLRIVSIEIYEHHKIKVDSRDTTRVDPFGIHRKEGIINHLTKLLNTTRNYLE